MIPVKRYAKTTTDKTTWLGVFPIWNKGTWILNLARFSWIKKTEGSYLHIGLMAGIFGSGWRKQKTPLQCLRHLCLNETLSDVHFSFNDGEKPLPGHKFVLAMRSEEFEKTFYQEISEKAIIIDDTSKEIFQLLLRLVYKQTFHSLS